LSSFRELVIDAIRVGEVEPGWNRIPGPRSAQPRMASDGRILQTGPAYKSIELLQKSLFDRSGSGGCGSPYGEWQSGNTSLVTSMSGPSTRRPRGRGGSSRISSLGTVLPRRLWARGIEEDSSLQGNVSRRSGYEGIPITGKILFPVTVRGREPGGGEGSATRRSHRSDARA